MYYYYIVVIVVWPFRGREKGNRASLIRIQRRTVADTFWIESRQRCNSVVHAFVMLPTTMRVHDVAGFGEPAGVLFIYMY